MIDTILLGLILIEAVFLVILCHWIYGLSKTLEVFAQQMGEAHGQFFCQIASVTATGAAMRQRFDDVLFSLDKQLQLVQDYDKRVEALLEECIRLEEART